MNNKASYKYAIAYGSNIGDRNDHIETSLKLIASDFGKIIAHSSRYESSPLGPADQAFLNGVVLVESDLQPDIAMKKLLDFEKAGGRTRDIKWGNRTIDLDILLIQHNNTQFVIDSELIKAPHPEAHKREFVMIPLAEVCPEWEIFPFEKTVKEIASEDFSDHGMKKT